jgi:hypothetical protein
MGHKYYGITPGQGAANNPEKRRYTSYKGRSAVFYISTKIVL